MSEQKKKKVNVRDLKPTKDAKGGYLGGVKGPTPPPRPGKKVAEFVSNFSFLPKRLPQ
jgi:hypothetical protein